MHHPAGRAALVALALVFVLAGSIQSQSVGKSFETHVRNSVGDAWAVLTAPVRGSGSDWLFAAVAVGGSALLSGFDDDVDRWVANHRDESVWSALKQVREGGFAFSGKTITPVAVGALIVALASNNQRLQEGLFGCLTAYATTSTVRNYVVYPLTARTRPDSGRGAQPPPARQGDQYDFSFPGSDNWGRHSFPAGHVANIAACTTFLTQRFSMGPMEPVAYTLVGGVGIGRLLDRRHWTSDTVIGLVFAAAVGRELAIRSSERERRSRGQ